MSQFILDMGSPQAEQRFSELPEIVRGYIEAIFFTESGTGDDAEREMEHATFAELSVESLDDIVQDVTAFEKIAGNLLSKAYARGYTPTRAGIDFWLTRNGHGTGFWDRDILEGEDLGHELAKLVGFGTQFPEIDWIYRGSDGLIHVG